MTKILYFIAILSTSFCYSQNLSMENGTFNRCAPNLFYDSGGEFGNYSDNESFTTTICPQNADEFSIINFIQFNTQLNQDILTIYDGDDITAELIGTYSGVSSPGIVSASDTNTSGCLTFVFTSNASGNINGWEAEILCATACQDIVASIDSTTPAPNGSGVIGILPGESVDFSGSATFSLDGTNAIFNWNFGDGNTAVGNDVTNNFVNPGTYSVTLTVADDNPQGCSGVETITVFVLGPNVVVDQDAFTPEELIEDVLVNSPCAAVTNIIWSTGTSYSFSEPNGIGYFYGDGVSFPFQDGLLLTSGDANRAGGPNVFLGDGSIGGWPGDTELDAATGIDSNNATFIQFDFTPLADTISFDFIMASEEYDMGGFECTFSDAFAFLLTDSMGNTTNLAVLPGTNTPILVTNIHPDNGASCGAANEQYFGEYTPNNGPPISFDGRTTVFTAHSVVTPGENYTIKLVIADDGDANYDSGVFLKAGSFDLGGDLGDDITIAAGTAECGGTSITLDTSIPTAEHVWYFEGEEILGETASTITVTETGTYTVDIVFTGVCQSSDSVLVEFKPSPTLNPASNLTICDSDGFVDFNLSENDVNILGSQNADDFFISYHLSEQDAIDNIGALPTTFINVINPQIIWARIGDTSQECFEITSFSIAAVQQPTINPVSDLELCDDTINDEVEEFDLSVQTLSILGSQSPTDFVVTYYLSVADADAGTAALPMLYTNFNNAEPIYVRVESSGDSSCYNASVSPVFNLVVNTKAIANTGSNMVACDDLSNDGIATFELSSQESNILGNQDPTVFTVTFHGTQMDADANLSPLPKSYTNTTPNLETIYARVENLLYPDCYSTTNFDVIVNALPEVVPVTPLEVCDDGTPDGLTQMDLSLKNTEITGNNPNYAVSYYETLADAQSETSVLPTLYSNTSNGQIIYVRVEDINTGCYNTTTLELVVQQAPIAFTPTPLRYCDPDNDGFGVFTLTDADNQITGGAPGLTVSYHKTLINANNDVDAIDTTVDYDNIEVNTETLYARVESATIATDCASLVELQLIVEPTPQLVDPTALEECDDISADGFANFDLTSKAVELLNGQDPTQYIASYYETQANAEAGTNPITNPAGYTNTTAVNQVIWIRVEDNMTVESCYKVTSLELMVHPLPVLVTPAPLELCDVNNPGDQAEAFTLEDANAEILNGQPGISLTYYETQLDADNATNPINSPYINTSNAQTIFVRAEYNTTGCYNTVTVTLRVDPVPAPIDQLPDLVLCDQINAGDGAEVFDLTENEVVMLNGEAGVTATYHETLEEADSGSNAIPNPTQYTNTQTPEQTVYVRVTNAITGCYALVDFTIIVNPLPTVVAVTDFIQCELNTDGFDSFDLTTKNEEVLNGQDATQFIVSYHESLAEAEAEVNALVSPYTNLSNPQQIFVTLTNTVTGCSIRTQSFNIEVHEAAQANSDMSPILYEQCDDNMETDGNPTNDSTQFDLAARDPDVLDGQDPLNYTVSYYATEADANLNVNPLPTLYENTINPQVIYARVDNNTLAVIPIALDVTALSTGLDLDADGTIDTYDTDADGIFDLVDVDGDGLSDAIDANADGIAEYVDVDGDGLGDPVDLNNDGVFDNEQDGSICFAVAALTLQVNPIPVFDLEESYILCINTNGTEVLNPLVIATGLSAMNYSFEWSYNGTVITAETGSSILPLEGGTYSVTVTDISTSPVTNCTNTDSTEVIESEPPLLEVNLVTQAFVDTNVIEALATGIGVYEYSLDAGPWQDEGTFTNVTSGNHIITARDKNGCGLSSESLFVIDYPIYFTPNGDGNHDTWNIPGIGSNAKIYIFDRYGKLLKQLSPQGAGWNGTFNGNRMPTSDYWFRVIYNEPMTNERKEFNAHFTLKR